MYRSCKNQRNCNSYVRSPVVKLNTDRLRPKHIVAIRP